MIVCTWSVHAVVIAAAILVGALVNVDAVSAGASLEAAKKYKT